VPNLSEEQVRLRLKEEWSAMTGSQQKPFHDISRQQGIDSGYDASELICVFCMCGTGDNAGAGWMSLSEEHALDFATGAYNDDAQLALNTFLRSRDAKCWFCPEHVLMYLE